MNRSLNVIRMQLVNRQTYIWVPLMVLGGSLLITLAIYALIHNAGVTGAMYGGGAQAPLWYFGVVGVQALTLTFPFSQAMSVTRWEFYLGTLATAVLSAVILAVIFVVGGYIELATGGWGMNGYFFQLPFVWEAGPWAAGLTYFTIAMLFFVVCFWGATIYKRWGTLTVTVVLTGVAALLVVIAFLLSITESWPTVWEGAMRMGSLGLTLLGIALVAILAASSYLTLRRATP